MNKIKLLDNFRTLEEKLGKEATTSVIKIIGIEMEEFKNYVDQRFNLMDQRFNLMDQRFNSLQWMMGIGFTITSGLMIALLSVVITRL